ncbi:MAG: methylenetetrahydrofolate reductase [Campylobacteraceae bacterium]|jgi:5,10-methylenetetrahydrofolate reductase|nr:methylenetetrahydrofolate reductase [Campylobacteraceae bacterium]
MYSHLKNALKRKKFLSLEVTPLHGLGVKTLIEKLSATKLPSKTDAFIITDNPLARLKSSSIITAVKLQEYFQKPAIATLSMRDRNKIALQADLLGANELDVRSILALSGDSAAASDQPNVKGVFEANSQLLLEIIRCFNAGLDYSGKPFAYPPKPINSFAVCNAKAQNPKSLQKKIAAKLRFTPLGIISQPVYSLENAKLLKEIFENAKSELADCQTELIFGFFPVTKLRTAQFLDSHVPGVHIPSEWKVKLELAKKIGDEEELKAGLELSRDILKSLLDFHPKIHIMGANNFQLLDSLVE